MSGFLRNFAVALGGSLLLLWVVLFLVVLVAEWTGAFDDVAASPELQRKVAPAAEALDKVWWKWLILPPMQAGGAIGTWLKQRGSRR